MSGDSANASEENSNIATSKMEEVATAMATWTLQNWNKCHKLLAAKSECIAKVGDILLRFFLLPVEKTLRVDAARILVNGWYSLNVQLVSSHQEACIAVESEELIKSDNGGVQVFLKKTSENPFGSEMIVEEFLLFGKWMVKWYSGKRIDSDQTGSDHPLAVVQEELQIPLKVTIFEFNETSSKSGINLFAKHGCNVKDNCQIKSNISTIFDESDGKLFSDVKLHMDDDVVLFAHRLILAGASPVFKAMFTTDMKESFSGDVKIPDICSSEMKIVLGYIYTGTVSASCGEHIAEVIHAASKYQLDDLLEYCGKLIPTICNPKNAMTLLKLAKTYSLPAATAFVTDYVKINASAILMSQVDI